MNIWSYGSHFSLIISKKWKRDTDCFLWFVWLWICESELVCWILLRQKKNKTIQTVPPFSCMEFIFLEKLVILFFYTIMGLGESCNLIFF